MQLYREILKLSQSPIYFKQTIQFYLWKPIQNPDGEQRAVNRETDISARSWTWALPDTPRNTLELPAAPNATVRQLSSCIRDAFPLFKKFSSEHQKKKTQINDKLS
jgi:hypothetical protein